MLPLLPLLLLPLLLLGAATSAAATPAMARREVALLSSHSVTATYAGRQERACMHRTSLCPDRCNHANAWAVFTVESYVDHAKPGQYGDERQTQFALQLRPHEERVAHAPGTLQLTASLAVGDRVALEWRHEYVSDFDVHDGRETCAKYPIRRVVALRRL